MMRVPYEKDFQYENKIKIIPSGLNLIFTFFNKKKIFLKSAHIVIKTFSTNTTLDAITYILKIRNYTYIYILRLK